MPGGRPARVITDGTTSWLVMPDGARVPLPAGGGDSGQVASSIWRWNTAPGTDPENGAMKANTAAPIDATTFTIHRYNDAGRDMTPWLVMIEPGDTLAVYHETNANNHMRYQTTGAATITGDYFRFPVAADTANFGGIEPGNGQKLRLMAVFSGGAGGGSAMPVRQTKSFTTTSLVNGSTGTGMLTLGNGYRLYTVTTSAPARVRLYTTAAKRTADGARPIGTDPTGDHGLIMEFISATSLLSADLSPMVDGFVSAADGLVPWSVTNLSGSPGAVTVQLTWVLTEA